MADITIIMPSYNKGRYIAEALDSVFMQETSYDYHIIVADDCSTDNTVEIVSSYQKKYPDKITVLTSKTNQKLYRNVLRAYEITKTDYFCVLDPDDYWIDKHKIQKALDFLEKNKDYSIYVTDTLMLMPDGTKKDFSKHDAVKNSNFNDFLNEKATLGCTLGSTFRNIVFKNGIPDKMRNLANETMERSFRGDTFRSILHLFYGKAHSVPEQDAVYRITEDGLWQGNSIFEQNVLNANIYKDLWIFFDKKYHSLLTTSYKFANKAKKDLLNELFQINDADKRNSAIEKIKKLQLFFEEYQEIIKVNMKTRYRLMLYIYKKLYKKLSKKGFI